MASNPAEFKLEFVCGTVVEQESQYDNVFVVYLSSIFYS